MSQALKRSAKDAHLEVIPFYEKQISQAVARHLPNSTLDNETRKVISKLVKTLNEEALFGTEQSGEIKINIQDSIRVMRDPKDIIVQDASHFQNGSYSTYTAWVNLRQPTIVTESAYIRNSENTKRGRGSTVMDLVGDSDKGISVYIPPKDVDLALLGSKRLEILKALQIDTADLKTIVDFNAIIVAIDKTSAFTSELGQKTPVTLNDKREILQAFFEFAKQEMVGLS